MQKDGRQDDVATPEHASRRHPLLGAQEGIWTGHQLDTSSPAYNTAEYVVIEGPVDADRFEIALRRAVEETEALHCVFVADDAGQPWQVDTAVPEWRLHAVDVSEEPDPHAAALRWIHDDIARPVDLSHGPLFGHALFRLAADRHLWYHRVHHIAVDGFGLSLFARRVADLYTALVARTEPGPSGFGTLASVREEEAAYRSSEQFARDREHWLRRYADRPDVATPAGRSALPAPSFLRDTADLGTATTAALRATAGALKTSWSEILLAVTAAHLHRATRAAEIVLSVPAMGRFGSASLRVPAMVRNVLPLRVSVGPHDTLRTLTAAVSREVRAALPHQRYRYEQIRRDLRLVGGGRRLSGPAVNIMPFAYDLRFAGLRSTVHNVSAGPVDDLAFNVYDRSEGTSLSFAVDANPDLYTLDEVTGHRRALFELLTAAVAEPDRPLSSVAPFPPSHEPVPTVRVLEGAPLPASPRPVLSRIADHAVRRGSGVAVEQGERSITYAGLLDQAHGVARRLAGRGVDRGDLVAVVLPRGIETVAVMLGVMAAGAVYCPLDPDAPADRTAALLATSAPALIVTGQCHAHLFQDREILLLGALTGAEPPHPPLPAPGPDEPAYVLHTSGSTGQPKGVEVGHGALAHFVAGAGLRYGPRRTDRVLQFAPPHFDTSIEEIFLTLCSGATLVIREPDMTDSVPHFLSVCERLSVTVLDLPTAYWHELAYALSTGAGTLPGAVHTVIIGGETALPERAARWRESVGTDVRLVNTYGPTEGTVVATAADLGDSCLAPGDAPIGVPLPGSRVAVVDGELYLCGPALAHGYRNRPVETAERFVRLEHLPGSPRAYRTGDLVALGEDGLLRHLGRADDEFKISGHRVQPSEVESALLSHPRISDAAVAGQVLPDGTRRLTAHLVADDPEPTLSSVRAHLRTRLPAPMIPTSFTFRSRLPRTSSGKTDRAALLAGLPLQQWSSAGPDEERTLTEVVTDVWRQVLASGELTEQDDVFERGAQSLQAIQAANRLAAKLGREVKLAWLFQYVTPMALAAFLSAGPTSASRAPAGSVLPPALTADAGLDPAVRPGARKAPWPPRRILLTGATGFVGSHLLAQLLRATDAEVVCAVRATSPEAALGRVHSALSAADLTLAPDQQRRVTALPADLARPRLGLSEQRWNALGLAVDAILHNGAAVSVIRDYTALRPANTDSTHDLLRLAAPRRVPLHYVSTLSVGPNAVSAEFKEGFLPAHEGLRYGYQQTKWASERLLEQAAERGLPVTVHRLGRVVGPIGTGRVNRQDFLWTVLRAGVPVGLLPDLFTEESWTAADRVAAEIVATGPGAHQHGAVVHHHAGSPVRQADLHRWLREYGYAIEALPLDIWRERIPRDTEDAVAVLTFFDSLPEPRAGAGDGLGQTTVQADQVRAALEAGGSSLRPAHPEIDRVAFFRQLDHCVAQGDLPSPAQRGPQKPGTGPEPRPTLATNPGDEPAPN
ncbi:amino acid adenylation domain-containing protein [Streptomyces sp. FT1]|uniref:amino acid adenylation domain-containing protein n=1 Tax=Streptomyces sp. FT1 TaxID=2871486 RepID=UPI0022564DC8|nr:amino acid adenylation domain-containing protein [Streptomyces sp. FT1]MCX5461198.1 amino acid adenylation domain-containing protein [Streptomyces sp. FT1]